MYTMSVYVHMLHGSICVDMVQRCQVGGGGLGSGATDAAMQDHMYIYGAASPDLTGPIMLPSPPAHPPVVWWWVLGLTPPPPLPPCNVVWCGGGLWVSGLVFNPFPPPCGVVVGVGFRVCTPAPPVVWVVGFRV